MGCSNPHPHGQVWATEHIPEEPSKELENMVNYKLKNGTCLLCDYCKLETTKDQPRLVCENASFVCVVPYWAVWPFETLVLSRNHTSSITEMSELEKIDLADIISCITCRYDNLFGCSFPYSMGIHQDAVDGVKCEKKGLQHFHMHYYPPCILLVVNG
jgi:UDPglucose--hexose-1-phosphate uridylyltransferase